MGSKNGVSSIFGPIITLFNYFNESKIELTPFFTDIGRADFNNCNQDSLSGQVTRRYLYKEVQFHFLFSHNYLYSFGHNSILNLLVSGKKVNAKRI